MNWFALSGLLTFVNSLGMGILSLAKGRRRLHKIWAIFNFSVALWGLGAYKFSTTLDQPSVFFWLGIGHIGVIFIPVLYLHFVFELLDVRKRVALTLSYLISSFFSVINLTDLFDVTDLFIIRLRYVFDSFFVDSPPGSLYTLFVAFFFSVVSYVLCHTVKAHRAAIGIRRAQIKYVIWATLVGFLGGGTAFLMVYGIDVYPTLHFGVPLYVVLLTYATVRYRFADITLVATRTAILISVYAHVIGLPLFMIFGMKPLLTQWFNTSWWVVPVATYGVLAFLAPFAVLRFQHQAEKRLLAEELKAHEALRFISQNMMRYPRESTLLKQTAKSLVRILRISHAAIYLAEGDDGQYRLKAAWHDPPRKATSLPEVLPGGSALGRDLAAVRIPRVKEELKLHQEALSGNWRDMVRTLDAFQSSVVIPAFHQRRFFGFLVLGDKRSGRIWTQDDLNLLMVLANQAVLGIENARFHEAEKERRVEQERKRIILDIASGASHQYGNRFQVIQTVIWVALKSMEKKDLKRLAWEELLRVAQKLMEVLQTAHQEAVWGGDISKGVMSLAQTDPSLFAPTEIPPLIEHAADFVKLKHAPLRVEQEGALPEIVNGVPGTLPKVFCNGMQIHDCIMNLIDNAVDAVKEKGRKIRSGELPAPPEPYRGRVQIRAGEEKGRLVVAVEDDGVGIKEAYRHRLFTPLFTTKGASQGKGPGGHGLGLAYIRLIMQAHGGKCSFKSEYGKGSRFTVELPVYREEQPRAA